MSLLRLSGELLLRYADRTFWALLLKLPPRRTRLEPVAALTLGKTVGAIAAFEPVEYGPTNSGPNALPILKPPRQQHFEGGVIDAGEKLAHIELEHIAIAAAEGLGTLYGPVRTLAAAAGIGVVDKVGFKVRL